MDFSWPDSYKEYQEKVKKFAQEELSSDLIDRDLKGEFSPELWKKCADFGIQSLAVTKEYGGPEASVNHQKAVLALEALGYGNPDNGLNLALSAHMWTVLTPLLHFGTPEQKANFIPGMIDGSLIGGHGLTEPEAGSDIYSMSSSAEKDGDFYMLNGKKRLITLAPVANLFLIFASVNRDLGKWGICAFLVEKGTEGLIPSAVQPKMGLRTVPIGEIELKDCRVPASNMLGNEGSGFSILSHSLEYDRSFIIASQLGTMERQLEDSIKFAKNRKQFGKAIYDFQSVSNRLADMKVRLETTRLLLYKLAWLKDQGKSAMLEATMLKLSISENFLQSSIDAVRIQGGGGFLTENEVERDLRDATGGVLYAGTSDIQRNIIARIIGLE